MNKVFFYDPDSITKDTLTVLKRKKYICIALTDDPDFFWSTLLKLKEDDIFVLLSHGDKDGPLPVKGQYGIDIDLKKFAAILNKKTITLYLLSCFTGNDPCASTLLDLGVDFVAPKGNAVFKTIGDETIDVTSKEGNKFPGWAGTEKLTPDRPNKALSLP